MIRRSSSLIFGWLFLAAACPAPLSAQETLDPIETRGAPEASAEKVVLQGWALLEIPAGGPDAGAVSIPGFSHSLFRSLARGELAGLRGELARLARADTPAGAFLRMRLVRLPDGDVVVRSTLQPQTFLVPRRQEAPAYPREAFFSKRGGEVHVEVMVDGEGRVVDADILFASPRNLFEAATLKAVKRWEFEPIREAGADAIYRDIFVIDFQTP